MYAVENSMKLTSFLSNGIRNGSLTLKPATTVIMGSRQLKIAPYMSIFPSFGSTGSIDKLCPANRRVMTDVNRKHYLETY